MSPPTQNRHIYPSPKERLNSYMAAIRLASSVRNSMDAQKAGADAEKFAPLADSYGRHHPNFPPHPPVKIATQGGREPGLTLNQTASAHVATNTTKPGFVNSQDGNPSPGRSVSTAINRSGDILESLKRGFPKQHNGYFPPPDPPTITVDNSIPKETAAKHGFPKQHNGYFPPSNPPQIAGDNSIPEETAAKHHGFPKQHNGYFPPPDPPTITGDGSVSADTTANAPTGVKPENLEQHNGYFPPPDPPIDSSQAGRRVSHRDFTLPATAISTRNDPSTTPLPPNGIPPDCQLYVHYSDPVMTYYVCPETKPTIINPTHDLASRTFLTEGLSIFDTIETNDTDACEAPTGFKEHLACADPNYLLALTIGLVLSILILCLIVQGCLAGCKKISRKFDEEAGTTTRPKAWKDKSFTLKWKKPQDLTTLGITTYNSEATLREPGAFPNLSTMTNSSEATLIEQTRTSARGHRLDERVSTEQYVPVAWRSRSHYAVRAHGGGRVVHDAGPVAALPGLRGEDRWLSHCEPLT